MTAVVALTVPVVPLVVLSTWLGVIRRASTTPQPAPRPRSSSSRRRAVHSHAAPQAAYEAVANDARSVSDAALVAAERDLRGRWHARGYDLSAGELIAWAALRDVASERGIPVPVQEDPR